MVSFASSGDMGPILQGYDNMPDVIADGGYIRVIQDVRGKYGSEGRYVMNRPMRGPLNATAVAFSGPRIGRFITYRPSDPYLPRTS